MSVADCRGARRRLIKRYGNPSSGPKVQDSKKGKTGGAKAGKK
jgi:hypothetical protein